MKRILALCLALLLLCGCVGENTKPQGNEELSASNTVGVWITAFELNEMLKAGNGFQQEFSSALDNLQSSGVNCIYVHVRAFADAYYPSALYSMVKGLEENIDPLKIMVDGVKKRGMKLFAWINPYRISTSTNDKSVVEDALIKTVGEENILSTENGLYFNPAADTVRRLVIDGVREVVKNYQVDGIHFDDYFYPTKDQTFDNASYTAYREDAATPLSLEDWRRANVNALISGTYSAIKAIDDKVLFSISPAANISSNYNDLFADVRSWCDGGYVDEIIPQLYFGFEYPDKAFRFDTLLDTWKDYLGGAPVRLLIGLPCYKAYTPTDADRAEWSKYDDIIPRQIQCIKEKTPQAGYVYFSYSSLKNGGKYEN